MLIKSDVLIGNGSLSEKRPGYYTLKIYYHDLTGEKKRKTFDGRDPYDLYEKANRFLRDREEIMRGINKDATIPQILRYRYEVDYRKGYVHEPGYYRNLDSLKKIEKNVIGSIPIVKVTTKDIDRFLEEMKDYSNSVLGKTYWQLKLAYREAVAAKIVERNLMESREFRRPKSNKLDNKIHAFTLEEQKRFVAGLKEYKTSGINNYKKQLLIELYTGMRMGEINALKPEDIDFANGVIHVKATISMGLGARHYRKAHPKTDAGVRDVPINELVRPVLEEALAEVRSNKEGTLFCDKRDGDVISTQQVCYFFRRVCEKYDLPYYGQHSLRHTFATRCIEAGVQPLVLKTWMGHTDIHITLDTYADVFNHLNDSAQSKLEDYLTGNEKHSQRSWKNA